jgi:hypothetical protein
LTRLACRLACLAYVILLTALLLVPDPARFVGLSRRPEFPWGSFGIHWIALAILSALVMGSFWPRRISWLLVAGLVVNGTLGEVLQHFVPPDRVTHNMRHVRWEDWTQNMLGVATGVLVYWLFWRRIGTASARKQK